MMQMHYFYEISRRVASIHQESERVPIPETNPTYSCRMLHETGRRRKGCYPLSTYGFMH